MSAAPIIKRFYGKKRGERNTRSDLLGGASLGLMSAVFFVGGLIGLSVAVATQTIPDFHANYGFRQTTCRIVEHRQTTRPLTDDGQVVSYQPELLVQYEVDDEMYRIWTYKQPPLELRDIAASQAVLDRYPIGAEVECWYDPHDPSTAVLERGHDLSAWLVLMLPLSFVAIGGGGLVYTFLTWGRSAEHRSALARRASRLEPFDDLVSSNDFPTVPRDRNLVNSPGTRLSYRLPSAVSSWNVLGVAVGALCWNSVVAILAMVAIHHHRAGTPDWMLTSMVVVFGILGIGLIVLFVRRLLAASGVGPTIIEIDRHPLAPGERCEVFLHQAGRLDVQSMRVALVCEEQAIYQQGTNTRTETQRVYEEPVAERQDVTVRRGAPLEMQWTLAIPAAAMHSFESEHNRVQWKLCVSADVQGWPRIERSYALHVFPVNETAVGA